MKKLFIALLVFHPQSSFSQSKTPKISKDSMIYYQRQLIKFEKALQKSFHDSLVRSPRYIELYHKINSYSDYSYKKWGTGFTPFIGIQINDFSNLNERLVSLNKKSINVVFGQIGMGFTKRYKKLIVGFDFSFAKPILPNDTIISSSGASLHTYISTNIIKTDGWVISPEVGYGLQQTTISIPTKSSSTSFNDFFTTSSNQAEIENKNSFLDFDLAFKWKDNSPEYKNRIFGIFKIGYRNGLDAAPWNLKNNTTTNAPRDRNNSFFAQIMLSLGY